MKKIIKFKSYFDLFLALIVTEAEFQIILVDPKVKPLMCMYSEHDKRRAFLS